MVAGSSLSRVSMVGSAPPWGKGLSRARRLTRAIALSSLRGWVRPAGEVDLVLPGAHRPLALGGPDLVDALEPGGALALDVQVGAAEEGLRLGGADQVAEDVLELPQRLAQGLGPASSLGLALGRRVGAAHSSTPTSSLALTTAAAASFAQPWAPTSSAKPWVTGAPPTKV